MSDQDNNTLGEILLRMGMIDQTQLDAALELRRSADADQVLGKILVAAGVCTANQIEHAVSAQKGLRSDKLNEQALASLSIAEQRKKRMRNANLDMIYQGARALKRVRGLELTPVLGVEQLARIVK